MWYLGRDYKACTEKCYSNILKKAFWQDCQFSLLSCSEKTFVIQMISAQSPEGITCVQMNYTFGR